MAVVSREPIIRTLTGLQIGLSFATSQTHGHEFRTLGVKYLGSGRVLATGSTVQCVCGWGDRSRGREPRVRWEDGLSCTLDDGPLDEGTLLICIHNECFGSLGSTVRIGWQTRPVRRVARAGTRHFVGGSCVCVEGGRERGRRWLPCVA